MSSHKSLSAIFLLAMISRNELSITLSTLWFDHRIVLLYALWCDRRMKLNASNTKIMMVSRSPTMHPQSPLLTIGGAVLKQSDDLVIFAIVFDSKMTFEKHLRSVSRAASQTLGILRKSWRQFASWEMLSGFCRASFGVLFSSLVSATVLPIHTLNSWTVQSVVPFF